MSGKRRTDTFDVIKDEHDRYVTFCKRKRGILKKAIELSRLCDQHIFMVIFDKTKQRIIEFSSKDTFNAKVVSKLTNPQLESFINHQKYTNDDFHLFQKGEKAEAAERKPKTPQKEEPPKKRRRKGQDKPILDCDDIFENPSEPELEA